MELLKRTKELQQRVSGLAAARGRHEEGKELDDFRAEKLTPRLERLAKVRATYDAFAQHALTHPGTLVSASMPAKVARLKDRFVQSPTRTTLVAPNGWPALQAVVDGGLADAESALREAWSAHCIAQVPQETVVELRKNPDIGAHPENVLKLQQYEKVHQQLARASSIVPRTLEQVDEFLALAGQAQSLLDQLNREPALLPPPDVQSFLLALQLRGAAGLELLTPEVLGWLSSTGRRGQFEVRQKTA